MDYNELFGIDPEEQEVVEPAPIGEEEQEVAEPVEPTEEPTEEPEEKPTQTKEERAKFAAERRKAETDAAIAKARQEEREKVDELIKRLGIPNPLDEDKLIQSFDELSAYEKNLAIQKMQNGTAKEEDFERIISESKVVKELREQAKKPEIPPDVERKMQADVDKIATFDPAIKTVDDLPNMDRFDEFSKYVKAGNNFIDAYKLTYFDKITQSTQAAAKQKALNASKSHLQATATRGQGALSVPSDEMALFKDLNPDMSESEIQKFYNKYKK